MKKTILVVVVMALIMTIGVVLLWQYNLFGIVYWSTDYYIYLGLGLFMILAVIAGVLENTHEKKDLLPEYDLHKTPETFSKDAMAKVHLLYVRYDEGYPALQKDVEWLMKTYMYNNYKPPMPHVSPKIVLQFMGYYATLDVTQVDSAKSFLKRYMKIDEISSQLSQKEELRQEFISLFTFIFKRLKEYKTKDLIREAEDIFFGLGLDLAETQKHVTDIFKA